MIYKNQAAKNALNAMANVLAYFTTRPIMKRKKFYKNCHQIIVGVAKLKRLVKFVMIFRKKNVLIKLHLIMDPLIERSWGH